HLLQRVPKRSEGDLSKIRARLVSRAALADVARSLDVPALLRLDAGARKQGGRDNERLLANAVEALLGAIHEDAGFERSQTVVLNLVSKRVDGAAGQVDEERDNPVNALQERVQGQDGITPRYVDLGQDGDPHAPSFRVAVEVDGARLGQGCGLTKKAARRDAARAAIVALGGDD
ncbi:MAG: ribonuclease-3, partial [Myxococcota bacterium]